MLISSHSETPQQWCPPNRDNLSWTVATRMSALDDGVILLLARASDGWRSFDLGRLDFRHKARARFIPRAPCQTTGPCAQAFDRWYSKCDKIMPVKYSASRPYRFGEQATTYTLGLLRIVAILLAMASVSIAQEHVRFDVHSDGTVSDRSTGLVWTLNADLYGATDPWAGLSWREALSYIERMNRGEVENFGHTDWRLPTSDELATFLTGLWRPISRGEELGKVLLYGIGQHGGHEYRSARRRAEVPFTNARDTAYWSGTLTHRSEGKFVIDRYYADPVQGEEPTDCNQWPIVVDTGVMAFPLPENALKRIWPVRGQDRRAR